MKIEDVLEVYKDAAAKKLSTGDFVGAQEDALTAVYNSALSAAAWAVHDMGLPAKWDLEMRMKFRQLAGNAILSMIEQGGVPPESEETAAARIAELDLMKRRSAVAEKLIDLKNVVYEHEVRAHARDLAELLVTS